MDEHNIIFSPEDPNEVYEGRREGESKNDRLYL
jgi:hypothetical protein